MSRYDYRDPGQDSEYCDGLAPEIETCDYCGRELPHHQAHYPYCSHACSIDAQTDSTEDNEIDF